MVTKNIEHGRVIFYSKYQDKAVAVSARICEKLYYYAIYWKTGGETEYS